MGLSWQDLEDARALVMKAYRQIPKALVWRGTHRDWSMDSKLRQRGHQTVVDFIHVTVMLSNYRNIYTQCTSILGDYQRIENKLAQQENAPSRNLGRFGADLFESVEHLTKIIDFCEEAIPNLVKELTWMLPVVREWMLHPKKDVVQLRLEMS